ncbi:Unknown protein, partial [Striga hermonthica]
TSSTPTVNQPDPPNNQSITDNQPIPTANQPDPTNNEQISDTSTSRRSSRKRNIPSYLHVYKHSLPPSNNLAYSKDHDDISGTSHNTIKNPIEHHL